MRAGHLAVLLLLAAGAPAVEASAITLETRDGELLQLERGRVVTVTNWIDYTFTGMVAGEKDNALVLCSYAGGLKRIETELIQAVEPLSATAEVGMLRVCLDRVLRGLHRPPAAPPRREPERKTSQEQDRAAAARVFGEFEERLYKTYIKTTRNQALGQTLRQYTTAWLQRRERGGYVVLSIGVVLTVVGLGFGIAAGIEDDPIDQLLLGLVTPAFAAPGVVMLSLGTARVAKTHDQMKRLDAEYRARRGSADPAGLGFMGAGPMMDREGQVRGATLGFRF